MPTFQGNIGETV